MECQTIQTTIHTLPREQIIPIFKKLDSKDLLTCLVICKLWNTITLDQAFLKKFANEWSCCILKHIADGKLSSECNPWMSERIKKILLAATKFSISDCSLQSEFLLNLPPHLTHLQIDRVRFIYSKSVMDKASIAEKPLKHLKIDACSKKNSTVMMHNQTPISLNDLPPTLETLALYSINFSHAEVEDFQKLPHGLKSLTLLNCSGVYGKFFAHLPNTLETLKISGCKQLEKRYLCKLPIYLQKDVHIVERSLPVYSRGCFI